MLAEYKAFLRHGAARAAELRRHRAVALRAAARFQRPPEDAPSAESDEVLVLREIRDLLARHRPL